MATRPTKFPEWARVPSVDPVTGGANVVEPTEQKKDTGWQREEKPPANYQNWLDNLTYQWLQYLDDNYQSQTGMVECGVYSAAKSGWVKLDDGTIGDASSGATTRANADTEELFTLLWGQVPDTWCPVSGGRGASAAADFSAHKTLTLFKTLGRAIACAGSGAGLTPRVVGENLGKRRINSQRLNWHHIHMEYNSLIMLVLHLHILPEKMERLLMLELSSLWLQVKIVLII